MSTPTLPPEHRESAEAADCPNCGSPVENLQEYCLECGHRLPAQPKVADAVATAWGRRGPWYAGDWVWPVLVALVVAVLAAATVVAAQSTRDDSLEPRLVATTTPEGPLAETTPAVPTVSTEPVVTLPEEETVASEPEPPPPPQRERKLIRWPSATNGYTVVIASVPKGERALATRRAKEASDAGLDEVGLLDSSSYASLVPGYLVVFSGVFRSRGEAERAIETARASGYNDAYAAQVAR